MFTGTEDRPQESRLSAGVSAARELPAAVVVLGMHRSGTSVVAGLLALLGCAAPATLLGAAPSNPLGHWESAPITAFDDRLLKAFGSSWEDWSPLDLTRVPQPELTGYVDAAASLLMTEFGQERLICLKDPRLCRLLPLWLKAFKSAAIEPVFVLPIRSPAEVAASLAARDGMAVADAAQLWLRYVLDAERATRGRTRAYVSYEQLLADWRGVASGLEAALGLDWPRSGLQAAAKIDAFVQVEHRHHALHVDALACPDAIMEWVITCAEIFDRWSRDGERRADHRRLDAVRIEFDRWTSLAATLFGRHRAELAALRTATAELASERVARAAAEAAARELMLRQERMAAALVHAYDRLPLPRPLKLLLSEKLVVRAGLIDAAWYLEQNEDVARQGIAPARHFARFGHREGRSPRPLPDLPG